MGESSIIEVSQAIRLYLPNLLSAADAAVFDQVIAERLAEAVDDPETAGAELERLLTGNRVTRRWMERALSGADPAVFEKRAVDVTTPPQPVSAPRYKCATCGFVWYRRNGSTLPACPNDGSALVTDGASA